MLYFENTTGNHNKFWVIAIMVDSTHNHMVGYETRWGRIGSRAQSKEKPQRSITAVYDLISSKMNKGYEFIPGRSAIQNRCEQDLVYHCGFQTTREPPELTDDLDAVERYLEDDGGTWRRPGPTVQEHRETLRRLREEEQAICKPIKPKKKSVEEILAAHEDDRFADLLE